MTSLGVGPIISMSWCLRKLKKCLLTSVCSSVKIQVPFLEKDKVAMPLREEKVERSALTHFCKFRTVFGKAQVHFSTAAVCPVANM